VNRQNVKKALEDATFDSVISELLPLAHIVRRGKTLRASAADLLRRLNGSDSIPSVTAKPNPESVMRNEYATHDAGRSFERATELLSAEHRLIERVLDIIERLTAMPVVKMLDSWKRALDFVRQFADQCHHLKEEKILFPAMEEHGIPNEGGPIGMMLIEHEEGRAYVGSMFAAVARLEAGDESAQEPLLTSAAAYLRLLREHIQKEDDILFHMADGVIPAEEQTQLLRTFAEHELNEMGGGVHEKYLAIAESLQSAV
jgi:hemerythrin-like domain-containing protein